MRLLHTSDWHLGQNFHKFDRSTEHRQFLETLTHTLVESQTDVLLIAGDVFDVANPPASAQRLFFEFLVESKRRLPHLKTVVIAGNHDSGARLEAPAELLRTLDVNVVGRVTSTPRGLQSNEDFLIPIYAETQLQCVFVAIPFLRSADVQWPEDSCSYTDAVVRTYRQAIEAARLRFGSNVPLVGLGHMHARGGTSSQDSERPLIIGGEEAVPLTQLGEDFCYFALGHLHLPQSVGGLAHVRYSGSPLPMSFSEIRYPHQMVLVELMPDGHVTHEILPVRRPVELLRCPKQPADLPEVLDALAELKLPEVGEPEQPYLEVQVRISGPTPDLRRQIENALARKPVRLAKISVSRAGQVDSTKERVRPAIEGLDTLRQLDPLFVFKEIHQREYQHLPDEELLRAFEDALRDVAAEETGA